MSEQLAAPKQEQAQAAQAQPQQATNPNQNVETQAYVPTYEVKPGLKDDILKAIGDRPAFLVNFPTNLYDYDDPDEERLPPHTDEIPLDWEAVDG